MNLIFKKIHGVFSDNEEMNLHGVIVDMVDGSLGFEQTNGYLSLPDELRAIADKIDDLEDRRHAK